MEPQLRMPSKQPTTRAISPINCVILIFSIDWTIPARRTQAMLPQNRVEESPSLSKAAISLPHPSPLLKPRRNRHWASLSYLTARSKTPRNPPALVAEIPHCSSRRPPQIRRTRTRVCCPDRGHRMHCPERTHPPPTALIAPQTWIAWLVAPRSLAHSQQGLLGHNQISRLQFTRVSAWRLDHRPTFRIIPDIFSLAKSRQHYEKPGQWIHVVTMTADRKKSSKNPRLGSRTSARSKSRNTKNSSIPAKIVRLRDYKKFLSFSIVCAFSDPRTFTVSFCWSFPLISINVSPPH
jgi:hypothetical protein